ncbi:MAG: hypothetical protein H6623_07390 [Bdellovibrionaceae bacterium]|nr:hypothetical protein [Pseudobdellovibrionaceae bacterium]
MLLALVGGANAHASVSTIETTVYGDNPWSFSGFSLATVDMQNYNQGGTGFFAYNYATINYTVADRKHFAFRIPFTYRSPGFDDMDPTVSKSQELLIDDLIVDYTDASNLLPFDIEVFSRIRYEAPTSKYSKAQNTLGSLRLDFIFSKHIVKHFDIEYWPILRWNMHTQTTYTNPDTNSLSHTKRYELNERLNFWYVPNGTIAVGGFIGTEDTWFNSSKVNLTARERDGRLAEHFLKIGPALRYNYNRHLSFLVNVANLVPMWGFNDKRAGKLSDLGKFKAEQTEFILLTFVNF